MYLNDAATLRKKDPEVVYKHSITKTLFILNWTLAMEFFSFTYTMSSWSKKKCIWMVHSYVYKAEKYIRKFKF